MAAGALFLNENRDISILNCIFNDNTIDSTLLEDFEFSFGGAIYLVDTQVDSEFYMAYCEFTGNQAEDGGAIHLLATKGQSFTFSDCYFNGNIALKSGGAAVIRNKNVNFGSSHFESNYANLGGAMLIANAASIRMDAELSQEFSIINPIFEYNVALDGGALALIGTGIHSFSF